jgi:cytochrome o ubiquinol oxidase operon protein cyoD
MSHAHEPAAHGGHHGTLKSYLVGFGLSLLLTLLSFGCVMAGVVPQHLIVPGLMVFCVAQVLVQLGFFLHMGIAPEQRENLMVGVCALVFIAIVVVGSLWVLHNMNAYMMPGMGHG